MRIDARDTRRIARAVVPAAFLLIMSQWLLNWWESLAPGQQVLVALILGATSVWLYRRHIVQILR